MNYKIDGKLVSSAIDQHTVERVSALAAKGGIVPGLAVIRVGDDPASEVYVRNKVARAKRMGVYSEAAILPADADQATVAAVISGFVARPDIHGILLQLPLPDHLDSVPLIESIPADHDVDGFCSANVAALAQGRADLVACTPVGSVILARHATAVLSGAETSVDQLSKVSLSGRHAVVVGRSQIVGRPLAQLLVQANCTVTIAHSRTENLPMVCRQADLLFLAVGRPEMVTGDWVKPGAIVIDVGINRIADPDTGKLRLVGDAHTSSVSEVAGAWTPVPGGVGPMTIACLLANAVTAAAAQHGYTADIEPAK